VAFDQSLGTETSFRGRLYPAYKANRESAPANLARQFDLCREFCRLMGIAEFASSEYEADDIIGTLVARSRAAGLRNVLVTRDKDLSQLIRDGDVFWDYSGNARYHYHDIGPRFGAHPEAIADFLALTGDSVDNIPGVPGIGRKTAAELFAVFASLDDLYANLDRVALLKLRGAASLRLRLLAHKEAAYFARRLTGIVCDMPLRGTPDDLRPRAPDQVSMDRFFDRHGFGNILRQQMRRIAAAAGN
jgi:5'-3' exonuclease